MQGKRANKQRKARKGKSANLAFTGALENVWIISEK
jgi:hypothetical protein